MFIVEQKYQRKDSEWTVIDFGLDSQAYIYLIVKVNNIKQFHREACDTPACLQPLGFMDVKLIPLLITSQFPSTRSAARRRRRQPLSRPRPSFTR